MALSGPEWVTKFMPSQSLDDLAEPFRTSVRQFVNALRAARATVSIEDTLRPPERAYLMHWSFVIAREGVDPATVPPMPGVDIQWVHPSPADSKTAAEQMVQAYHVVFKPVLVSRHTQKLAVDMDITWTGDLAIAGADGTTVTITSQPRTGAANTDLHQIAKTYGVIKLATDAPHWSNDGH
jgi:hypothetical protein